MTVTAVRFAVGLIAAATLALAGCDGNPPPTTPTESVSPSTTASVPLSEGPAASMSSPHLQETTTPAPSTELTPQASPAPPASSPAIQQSEPTFLYCEYGTAIYSDQSYVVGDPRCPQPTANEDPYSRDYKCDEQGTNCTYPDGSPVPGYRRCGTQCGEAPTSGEVQRKWMECIAVKSVEQCRAEQ